MIENVQEKNSLSTTQMVRHAKTSRSTACLHWYVHDFESARCIAVWSREKSNAMKMSSEKWVIFSLFRRSSSHSRDGLDVVVNLSRMNYVEYIECSAVQQFSNGQWKKAKRINCEKRRPKEIFVWKTGNRSIHAIFELSWINQSIFLLMCVVLVVVVVVKVPHYLFGFDIVPVQRW